VQLQQEMLRNFAMAALMMLGGDKRQGWRGGSDDEVEADVGEDEDEDEEEVMEEEDKIPHVRINYIPATL